MKEQQCRFCPQKLQTFNEVPNRHDKVHGITEDNSPTFQSYINTISRDSKQMFVEYCEYYKSPPFFNSEVKSRHYLRHLKLFPALKRDILIREIGNRFLEFSIDYIRHSKAHDFMNPNKVINELIENVARLILKANGEFRLVCCIVNQSVVEFHGRRLYTNSSLVLQQE